MVGSITDAINGPRRRRFLQAMAVGLTGSMAGCVVERGRIGLRQATKGEEVTATEQHEAALTTPVATLTATSTPNRTPTATPTPAPQPTPIPQREVKLSSVDASNPSASSSDRFGQSVAVDGDTAVVGAFWDEDPNGIGAGSVYVFERSGDTWTPREKLLASDGGGFFGYSVALDGNTAVVGAYSNDIPHGKSAGAAYVFIRSASGWIQQTKLVASDGEPEDEFGRSVALDGETTIVGAPKDDNQNGPDAGSAYVFARSGATWIQRKKLIAYDGSASDWFGTSVALDGRTAIVGTPRDFVASLKDFGGPSRDTAPTRGRTGSAYVFTRTRAGWSLQAKLVPGDGRDEDEFGTAVATNGDMAIIGAPNHDIPYGDYCGAAYAFTRSGSTWTQEAKLSAVDGDPNDLFGRAVTMNDDTAIVGAPLDEDPADDESGTAYVFTRLDSGWWPRSKLIASDGFEGDRFGTSVSMSGETVIVGAPDDEYPDAPFAGSASVFWPI